MNKAPTKNKTEQPMKMEMATTQHMKMAPTLPTILQIITNKRKCIKMIYTRYREWELMKKQKSLAR